MKKISLVLLVLLIILCSCSNNTIDLPEDNKNTTANSPEPTTSSPETTKDIEKTKIPETTATPNTETKSPETTAAEYPIGHIPVTQLTLDKYTISIYIGSTDMPWVTMSPENATNKSEIWSSSDTSIATVDMYGNITGVAQGKCTVTVRSADNQSIYADVAVTVNAHPELTYINGILIANKTYALPSTYNPGNDKTAENALYNLFAAARAEGYYLYVNSGFRSYNDQKWIYNDYVTRDGKANADRYSARPGHSEHQTGLAFDILATRLSILEQSFGDTPEGIWLANNCWKYGFIIRYPKDKEHITGYMYEPWHIRYIGVENATAVYQSGLCLEEYLGITSVYANP